MFNRIIGVADKWKLVLKMENCCYDYTDLPEMTHMDSFSSGQ